MSSATILQRPVQGFTLIELMISMVLGLVMIGAASTVFLSNQQTFRTKAELDGAQEAFRFSSHTIQRIVQTGDQILDPDANLLRVRMDPAPGKRDCLGQGINGSTINTLFIDDGRLRCEVDNDSGIRTETLADSVDVGRTNVSFGVADDIYWNNNAWQSIGGVADWNDVRSVRVEMAMQADGDSMGPAALFTATLRCHPLGFCADP